MTVSAWLVMSSVIAIVAAALTISGLMQERPTLHRTITRLARTDPPNNGRGALTMADRIGGALDRSGVTEWPFVPSPPSLRLIDRTPGLHAATMLGAAVMGFVAPLAVVGLASARGWLPLGLGLPMLVAVTGAVVGPLAVHLHVRDRIEAVRMDLRHQTSAYLDVVTMLLAGNTGHEGALEQAARAGDGRLFRELRRRMREISAAGHSLVDALDLVGRDLGLVELRQIAATASLSAAEGAPVSRTLAAKCSTMRSVLASEQESEARLRTSRLTPPLVGMSLIFMALIIYPALGFAR